MIHPSVWSALVLEHGCEKTQNHVMVNKLKQWNIPADNFGWASIQLDGGIEKVKQLVEDYFISDLHLDNLPPETILPPKQKVGLEHLWVGMLSASSDMPPEVAKAFAQVAKIISGSGGRVVVPSGQGLLTDRNFLNQIVEDQILHPSLLYGQPLQVFHKKKQA